MKKTAIFWDMIAPCSTLTEAEKFGRVGLNTGNMIFIRSLMSIFQPDILPRWTMEQNDEARSYFNAEDYDAFLTTELIWITPNCEYPHVWKALDRIGDKPLVPISVGLQNHSRNEPFHFAPDTIRLLKTMEERAVLGVRGEYTASVLAEHGIKNIQVIGCPSVFYGLRDELNIPMFPPPPNAWLRLRRKMHIPMPDTEINKVTCNFRTIYGSLKASECHFLTYAANHNWEFVEQTHHKLEPQNVYNNMPQYEYLRRWLDEKTHLFFDPDDWANWIKDYQFSIGSRFHGNVIALTNGVPALTMTVDSRMSEMCEFFHMPTFNINEFDMNKPVSFYYEKADPSDFLATYPLRLANFKDFLARNNLL